MFLHLVQFVLQTVKLFYSDKIKHRHKHDLPSDTRVHHMMIDLNISTVTYQHQAQSSRYLHTLLEQNSGIHIDNYR